MLLWLKLPSPRHAPAPRLKRIKNPPWRIQVTTGRWRACPFVTAVPRPAALPGLRSLLGVVSPGRAQRRPALLPGSL